jgi:hypothetical protein
LMSQFVADHQVADRGPHQYHPTETPTRLLTACGRSRGGCRAGSWLSFRAGARGAPSAPASIGRSWSASLQRVTTTSGGFACWQLRTRWRMPTEPPILWPVVVTAASNDGP